MARQTKSKRSLEFFDISILDWWLQNPGNRSLNRCPSNGSLLCAFVVMPRLPARRSLVHNFGSNPTPHRHQWSSVKCVQLTLMLVTAVSSPAKERKQPWRTPSLQFVSCSAIAFFLLGRCRLGVWRKSGELDTMIPWSHPILTAATTLSDQLKISFQQLPLCHLHLSWFLLTDALLSGVHPLS